MTAPIAIDPTVDWCRKHLEPFRADGSWQHIGRSACSAPVIGTLGWSCLTGDRDAVHALAVECDPTRNGYQTKDGN